MSTMDARNNSYFSQQITQDFDAAWKYVSETDPNAIVAARVVDYERNPGQPPLSYFHAASLSVYHGLQPFNAQMSPRQHAEFLHFTRLKNNPVNLANRGMQYYATNGDDKRLPVNQFALVQSFGDVKLYKSLNPRGRLNKACDIFGRNKYSCGGDINIQKEKRTNTVFEYSVDIKDTETLSFYGFDTENWHLSVNGEARTIKWDGEDQIIIDLPPGQHKIGLKYKNIRQSKLWILFAFGLLSYIGFLIRLTHFIPVSLRNRRVKLKKT